MVENSDYCIVVILFIHNDILFYILIILNNDYSLSI